MSNSAPTGLKLSSPITPSVTAIAVPENSPAGTVVGTLSATDPEGGAVTYVLTDDANGLFVIDGNQIKLAQALGDFETATNKIYQITVEARDPEGNASTATFGIRHADAYDSPEGTLTIDASGVTGGVDFATFISDYFAGLTNGSSTFYGGTPTGSFNLSGEQIAFKYKEGGVDTADRVVLGGDGELTYDYFVYGSSYGHGISGKLDSITFGQWVDGVTSGTAGTGDAGLLTGLLEQLKISGFDLESVAGSGHVASINLVYALYSAVQTGNAATIYSAISNYAQNFIGSAGNDVFTGSRFDDVINGGDGDDILSGGEGNDIFIGGGGNDTIDGGDGVDTVVYDGNFVGGTYSYSGGLNGAPLIVTDSRSTGGQGVDTLTNIEFLKFADLTYDNIAHRVNYVPTDVALDVTEVDGSAAVGAVVGSLAVTDKLNGGVGGPSADTHTLTLVNDAGGKFVIDGTQIKVAGALTADSYTVRVKVVDGAGHVLEKDLTISVTGELPNAAPVITSNGGDASATVNVAENKTAVTTVKATDPDAGNTVTYSISGGADKALFTINAATGALSFKTAPNFEAPKDAGKNNVYDVVVKATDAGGLSDTQALAVKVTNVNEAPKITSNGAGASASVKVAENKTAVTTVKATDVDAGAKLTYSLSGGADKALFKIDAKTGALSFKTAPDFETPKDAGKNNVYDVTVKVSDGKLTDTQALKVTVSDVKGKTLNGTSKADTLSGTVEADTLNGKAGNDTLKGNAGDDKLYGGAGADKLYGGAGKDTFVFKSVKDSTVAKAGLDTIFDFDGKGGDRIDLTAIDANTKVSGDQAFSFVGTKAFSKKAGELRYEKTAAGTDVYGDVNGDGKADFAIHFDDAITFSKGFFLL